MKISKLSPGDFEKASAFWTSTRGMMGQMGTDSEQALATFLKRNPGLSFKVVDNDEIVGTILCGHDGRRGYLHHLAVAEQYLGQGLGKVLTDRSIEELRRLGIAKCHLFVDSRNSEGQQFWKSIHWNEQNDIRIFSHDIEYPSD